MKSVGRGLALVLGHAVQFGVRRRPNGDRIEEYFVVLGEIGGRVAIDECRPSGPTGLEQRSVREKPRHRLHVPYLFSPTTNHLTGLKQRAAARLSTRGKSAANNQHSEPIIEKMPAPSVRHVRRPQLSSVSQRPPWPIPDRNAAAFGWPVNIRERNSRSPITRPTSLKAKNGINATARMTPTKNTPIGVPPPITGMLSPIVFPLNTPTINSSTTSKTKNKIENATALHKIG